MAYEVIVAPIVYERLDEVVGYTLEVLGSPLAALGILDGFDKAIENLEQSPNPYSFSGDERLRARGYRKASIGRYVILFRVWDSGERTGTVWVTNLCHTSQNDQGLV